MMTWREWLRRNSAPSLQSLVEQFDGYDKIPWGAWEEFDRQVEAWRKAYRLREYDADEDLL